MIPLEYEVHSLVEELVIEVSWEFLLEVLECLEPEVDHIVGVEYLE
jgi:hypothetical protein